MGQECSRGETLPRRRAQCEGFVKGLWRNIKGGAPYIFTCFWPTKNHSNIHNRCVSCSLSGHAAMKDLENQTFTPVMKPRSGPTLPWMVENRRVHTQKSDFQQIRRIVWRRECFFGEIITYKGPEGGGETGYSVTRLQPLLRQTRQGFRTGSVVFTSHLSYKPLLQSKKGCTVQGKAFFVTWFDK